MQVTQSAMTQIQQIAATFVADMPNLNGVNSQEVDSIAANAQHALTAGRRPAGHPGRQRLCLRRTGQQQPASALTQRYPVIGLLHKDQCRGFSAFRERCGGDHLGDAVDRRFQCHRHVAVLRLYVADRLPPLAPRWLRPAKVAQYKRDC